MRGRLGRGVGGGVGGGVGEELGEKLGRSGGGVGEEWWGHAVAVLARLQDIFKYILKSRFHSLWSPKYMKFS